MLESKTARVDGIGVHYWEGGKGFPLLMIHGVGPGTSIQGNFGPVLEPLAAHCRIVAIDLIGFGASGRKPAPPYFDVDLWLRQAEAMLAYLPGGECGIAGHSMGGAIVQEFALHYPGRLAGIVLVGTGARLRVAPAMQPSARFLKAVSSCSRSMRSGVAWTLRRSGRSTVILR